MLVISQSLVLAYKADPELWADAPVFGWRNVVAFGGVSADKEDDDFPAVNLANPSTALRWQGTDAAPHAITVATPAGEPVDYVGIAGHNFGSGQISVRVEAASLNDAVLGAFGNGIDGFVAAGGSGIAAQGGKLVVTAGASGYPSAFKAIPTVAGQFYVVKAKARRGTTPAPVSLLAQNESFQGLGPAASTTSDSEQELVMSFVATGAVTNISLFIDSGAATTGTAVFDDVTISPPPVGFDVWAEVAEETMPADDSALFLRFAPVSTSALRVSLAPALGIVPRAAVLYAGKAMVMPRGIEPGFTPLVHGVETEVQNNRSESGNFLGRIVRSRKLTSSVSFRWLDPVWFRANMVPFFRGAQEAPFFFAWAPASHPEEAGYAWLSSDPGRTIANPDGSFDVSLAMGGVA